MYEVTFSPRKLTLNCKTYHFCIHFKHKSLVKIMIHHDYRNLRILSIWKKNNVIFLSLYIVPVWQHFCHTYFVFLYRVCGLAQSLSLKVIILLLSLVHDDPLLMDPRSLSNTTKELDVILPVTCTKTEKEKQAAAILSLHFHIFVEEKQVDSERYEQCLVHERSYLWCWCECGHSSAGQRRPCRATRGRFPP